jgi:hypothetical protein
MAISPEEDEGAVKPDEYAILTLFLSSPPL